MRYLFLLLSFLAVRAQAQDGDYAAEIARHRQHYKDDFLNDPRSPLKAPDTAYLDFFPPDITWRVEGRFELTPDAQPFDLPTYSGKTARYVQYGRVFFTVNGHHDTLNIYRNLRLTGMKEYADYLFLPFKDPTCPDLSYGGGRYLDLRTGNISADNNIVIDFNKAYNPYCAYSSGYSCPVPPKENYVDIPVRAGEKNFRKEVQH